MTNSLIIFTVPDEQINAIDHNKNEEYTLEIGDDIIYESEDMSDKEICEWAEESGYLDEEGYVDEDGKPDIESLRELKRSIEEEYPTSIATPSGRAFLFFEGKYFPENIDISVIDGLYPGNDWQGVIVKGFQNLSDIQKALLENGTKVNFIIQ